jgi:hypothetical protein
VGSLREEGGKRHEIPAHHKLEQFIDEYLDAAGIRDAGKTPVFRGPILQPCITSPPSTLMA